MITAFFVGLIVGIVLTAACLLLPNDTYPR